MKRIGLIVICFAAALAVVSCKGKSGDAKTNMLIWMPPFGTEDTLDREFWVRSLAPWTEQNKVNLSVEIIPWGNFEEKYITGFSSGMGPDVAYNINGMFDDLTNMGVLEDLDSYFTAEERQEYIYWDLGKYRGKQYAVPIIVGNPRILFVNKDLLAQAGVTELPVTWDDLVQMCLKVKNASLGADILPFACMWTGHYGSLQENFLPYFFQAGGEFFNADGTKVALLDHDAGVRAVQFVYDLMYTHQVLPAECLSFTNLSNDIVARFAEGKIAAAIFASTNARSLDQAGVNWDFVSALTDRERSAMVAVDFLTMNSASKHKELAASLIKFILSPPIMEAFHEELFSGPPITRKEAFKDNPRFETLYSTTVLKPLPMGKNGFKIMDTLVRNIQRTMLREITPEQAIRETVSYSQTLE